jgi:predicted nucleic acid-binding protein
LLGCSEPPTFATKAGRPRFGAALAARRHAAASVCQAEILAGIAVMAHGRRRESLETAARAMFEDDFADRVLPFDQEAAIAYGDLFAGTEPSGAHLVHRIRRIVRRPPAQHRSPAYSHWNGPNDLTESEH